MLTKIKDNWWVDISKIFYLFNDQEIDKCDFCINDFTYNCSYEDGLLLEKELNEYYLDNTEVYTRVQG